MNIEAKVCAFLMTAFFSIWLTLDTSIFYVHATGTAWWMLYLTAWYFYALGYGFLLKFFRELHSQ